MTQELAEMERILSNHKGMEIKNLSRLQTCRHKHTKAMCTAIAALGRAFKDKKIYILVEAEITDKNIFSRPEDIVAWIEEVGVFVIEVKSHLINGIRSFERCLTKKNLNFIFV
mgnify:CR=1 FL=1